MGRAAWIVIGAATASLTCGRGAAPEASRPAADIASTMATARAELLEADRAFARATADRGIEGWVEWFEPRGTMVRREGDAVGADAIRALMTPLLGDSTVALRWRPDRAEVSAGGDLGFTVGPSELVALAPAPGEDARRGTGRYLTVWRRQADGTWKVLADIGSMGPPLAE